MSAEKGSGQDSGDMARGRHGFGTFDTTTRTWKLRTKSLKVAASIRKLREKFGEQVPDDERKSYSFWLRFLDEVKAVSVLQDREMKLAAARIIFDSKENAPYPVCSHPITGEVCYNPPQMSEFQRNPLTGEIEYRTPLSPDVVRLANMAMVGDYAGMSAILKKNDIPKGQSLRAEIADAVELEKKKGTISHYPMKQYLDFFADCCGQDIRLSDITVTQYREFLKRLDAAENWGDNTKNSVKKRVDTFLRRVGADHDLAFGFVGAAQYRRSVGDGQKVQWTVEEVRVALEKATGLARVYLLLGLNCGFYAGDIEALTPDKVVDGRIETARAKLEGRGTPFIGSWKLWPETMKVLQYGATASQLVNAFTKFRKANNLPEAKGLRKTVSQLLQDHVSEEVARMYRGEKVSGTHGSHYIRFSPAQVAKLDAGLDVIRGILFPEFDPFQG